MTDTTETTTEVVQTRHVERDKDFYSRRRVRRGKTQRDHESGAWRRNKANVTDRGNWANEVRGKNGTPPPMPVPHGNGNSCVPHKIKPDPFSKG